MFHMARRAVVLLLISIFFCCGKFLGNIWQIPFDVFNRSQLQIQVSCFVGPRVQQIRRTNLHTLEGSNMHLLCTDPPSLQLLLLTSSRTSVYGAYLEYRESELSGSPSNVTLSIGELERVLCLQPTGPVPTSIQWYNPQGQLVSRKGGDAVRQHITSKGSVLIFQSYQQSQGGKYECRVSVSENILENLSVCIGEYRGVTVTTWLNVQVNCCTDILYIQCKLQITIVM